MGNKQSGGVSLSGSQQHVAEPTSRSFSWQPDPLFAGEPVVKRGESFAGSGVRPPNGQHPTAAAGPPGSSATMHRTYASSEYGSPGVYRNRQASSPNLATNGNGSVVRGDAAFGGVQKELKPANNKSSNASKSGNLVNTADSGYMTEIAAHDSDNSARGRLRGSRLSLNDAMLGGTEFVQRGQHQHHPQMMHPPPGMPMGPHHHFMALPPPPPGAMIFGPPPPGFGHPPHPDSFMFPPPMLNARGAPIDEKKAKKLRKKQQKNQQQQLSRQPSALGEMQPGEFIPPFPMINGPVIAFGPPPQMQIGGNFRSRSIDNFMAAGLIQQGPAMLAAPPPPPHHHHLMQQPGPHHLPVRRYNSHVDVSGIGGAMGPVNYHSATLGPGMGIGGHTAQQPPPAAEKDRTPPAKREGKYQKRKDQQQGSLRDSLSSSRGRLADTPFGMGGKTTTARPIEVAKDGGGKESGDLGGSSMFVNESKSGGGRSEVIYETLKGAQRAMMATSVVEINTITVNGNQEKEHNEKAIDIFQRDSPPPPTPKPVVITPEAKAILERNARILVEAEQREEKREQQHQQQLDAQKKKDEIVNEQKTKLATDSSYHQTTPVISKMVEELRKIPTPPPPPPLPPSAHLDKGQKEMAMQNRKDSKEEGMSKMQTIERTLHAEKKSEPSTEHQAANKTEKAITNGHKADQSNTISSSEKMSATTNDASSSSKDDSDDIESMIEATLNPILPRRKYKKPKDFEPLDAWRGINVQQELAKRQPQRNALESSGGNLIRDHQQQPVVEERIQVRLVPTAPSRREQSSGEPIYLEYDERLPEFKKRLIETGSFDIPEVDKFHHHRSSSQLSTGSRGGARLDMSPTRWDTNGGESHSRQVQPPQQPLWRDYVAMEEAAAVNNATNGNGSVRSRKTVDSNKGSLRKLKESMANMFRTKSSDQLKPTNGQQAINTSTDDMPPMYNTPTMNGVGGGGGGGGNGRYAPSLTPSTSKIKAGDSSDIDFSWVHDLETRFRLEREQFERELQTLKQKSATLQRNDYVLSPKLQRQQSPAPFQPRMESSEIEIGREENRYSPSIRGPNHPQSRFDNNNVITEGPYREKTFSSSIDLSGGVGRAQTPPPPGRMSAYHSQQALNDNVLPTSRLMMEHQQQQQANSRYFGVYDTAPINPHQTPAEAAYRDPYERSFRTELQQMAPANVRQKAALFESESHRVQREMDDRNQQLVRQKQQQQQQQQRSSSVPQKFQPQPYRMSLQPQRSIEADEPIYIPRPDYDEGIDEPPQRPQHHRQHSGGGRMTNGHQQEIPNGGDYPGGRYGANEDRMFTAPYHMDEPLVVNTAANTQGAGGGGGPRFASPRSPSERRLARFYNSHANVSGQNGYRGVNGAAGRYESQPALNVANGNQGQRYGQYSPSSRSPRMANRAQQQQQQQYHETNRNNGAHWGRSNGFENGQQQQPMTNKANRMGPSRPIAGGSRGVAFANE